MSLSQRAPPAGTPPPPTLLLAVLERLRDAAPSRSKPSPALAAACRAETDRVYSAQNRSELSDAGHAGHAVRLQLPARHHLARAGRAVWAGQPGRRLPALSNASNSAAAAPDPGTGPHLQAASPR